ncbi:cytochrome c biogenesis CcdA family protein [Pseudalkalibacillus decolorationis]|uniref:cytochrome c biogenesis CcdA family protein n=1 Tax=Pseudalkalibacillus decolorationis TaxID=163879 RepID=UPI0027E27F49|nr:cytochrome c biogenesis protein CcdA [Pseudalkalibacillus decolorationis]
MIYKEMENVTIFIAFTAGLVSFFSPCVFPLIPAYVANLTGSTIEGDRVVVGKKAVFIRSITFIIGFSIIFVLLGASASFLGGFLAQYQDLITRIGGLLIIMFGMQMTGLLQMKLLMSEKRFQMDAKKEKNFWRSLIMGMVFAAGWSPCVGLALSSILILAGSSGTLMTGIFMLIVYSLGLAIPFLLIAFLITYSLKVMKRINKWMPKISTASGWLLIALGLLLFTGQLQKISAWLTSITGTYM